MIILYSPAVEQRLRFAALTGYAVGRIRTVGMVRTVIVPAEAHVVGRQHGVQTVVNFLKAPLVKVPSGYAGLVGDDD